MAEHDKPVVNLEVSTGFFRIATEQAIYNITVLGGYSGPVEQGGMSSGPALFPGPAVDRQPAAAPAPGPENAGQEPVEGDDYYKQVSQNLFSDIGKLAKQLTHTIMEIPAEDRQARRAQLDEAGERIEEAKNQLKDVVAMTEQATMEIMDRVDRVQAGTNDLKNLLSFLREHQAFKLADGPPAAGEEVEPPPVDYSLVNDLRARLVMAGELAATATVVETGGNAAPVVEAAARTRYLFPIDPVLQTMYELCTNETVKAHITAARKNAENLISRDVFVDRISPRVSGLAVEDGFINVPLEDVLGSLREATSDKAMRNLFKNMEGKRDQIFLDQSLPLEAPATEEPATAAPGPAMPFQSVDLAKMLAEAIGMVDALATGGGGAGTGAVGMRGMSLNDQREIFAKIENAFAVVSSIGSDVFRITESLSFQDLSGQQIMKIIKLLSDFQIQLLAMVVSFGSQLKNKEKNVHITAEESKKLAQNDVDSYINKIVGGTTEGGTSLLDQEAVNNMLQEFGF